MAQLETLEAKMASIEVSLSSTPRRKKNGSISGVSVVSSNRHSIPKEFALKELETLRNALKDKENIIQNLRSKLGIPNGHMSHIRGNGLTISRDLSEVEKKQAEDRLTKLRTETDNKRLVIKNLKFALERLDITDNIDVRIQQAELEYQLGREELNLLTLLEETRALQICLEESTKNNSQSHTLYSCVKTSGHASLHAVEILHDPKSPRFGAGGQDSHNLGLWIDWALEGTGLYKGDRLVEVNGKFILNKTGEDLKRLLAAAPDPAQIVILRSSRCPKSVTTHNMPTGEELSALRSELGVVRERAEETQKAKDGLICDNIRLTHRISYLEEQVSELLLRRNVEKADNIRIVSHNPGVTSLVKTNQNVTNINITSQPPPKSVNDLQIFQKGPQVTALVANIPGLEFANTSLPVRSRSSLSNVSNTHIPAISPQPAENHCHNTKSSHQRHKSPKPKTNHHHHHHHHQPFVQDSSMERSFKQASMIVHDLTTKSKQNGQGHHPLDPIIYEKHRSKSNNITASEKYNSTHLLKHYNARKSASVLDFHSKLPERKIVDARSVKSLDFDNDHVDYTSEPIKQRPQPPKKPIRLSLHKTQSLQSVDTPNGSSDNTLDSRKSLKRNHKGEAHFIFDCKSIASLEQQKPPHRDYGQLQKSNGLSGLKWSAFSSSK